MKTINILGTKYTIKIQNEKQNPKMRDAKGICELYSKELIVDTSGSNDFNAFENVEEFFEGVLRHEKFHAIFHEAGLSKYMEDETLIEALAQLYPKIKEIMDNQKLFS